MRIYLERLLGHNTHQIDLIEKNDFSALRKRLKRYDCIRNVTKEDDKTLLLTARNKELKGRSCLKDVGEGQLVLATYWDVKQGEELLFHIGATLWNDNKKGSHFTCAYLTQNQHCVIESHLNVQWGIPVTYFTNWIHNYFMAMPQFQQHLANVKESFERLPQDKLSLLEKIWMGAEIVGSAASILKIMSP